jgi:adenylate cyclase
MAIEIERKFLVDANAWASWPKEQPHYLQQGYLFKDLYKTCRIRVSDGIGYITIKGKTVGISRAEHEFEIPREEAAELLKLYCDTVVTKHRYLVPFEGKLWEVDVFLEENEGLLIAEIELTEENESFTKPAFITQEVTGDKKYYNAQLAINPYKMWDR